MDLPNVNVMAGPTAAMASSNSANVLSRVIQGVRNLVGGGRQPDEPLFAFTEGYFDEFPAQARGTKTSVGSSMASIQESNAGWWVAGETSSAGKGLPVLAPQRLSAGRASLLALAAPGLGSALVSVGNERAALPMAAPVDACTMLCFPGAGAELVRQRRVEWSLQRRQSPPAAGMKASMPTSVVAKINLFPPARALPSAPGAPTFLSDVTAWNDDVVSRLAVAQFKSFMGALPRAKWQSFLTLRTAIRATADTITADLQTSTQAWEDDCVAAINAAIHAKVGPQPDGPLDCRTTWLHTDYLEIRSRSTRALADGQPVPRRRSVTLWDAARQNFSYAVAWDFDDGKDFAAASFVSTDQAGTKRLPALSVSTFASIVRDVDPGSQAAQMVDDMLEPGSLAYRRLQDLQANSLVFDILDAARSPATTGVHAAVRDRLQQAAFSLHGNEAWSRYRGEFGIAVPTLGVGHWVQLPFFTYQVNGVAGVVAHAMGRPDYPLRVFSDVAKAQAWLNATVDLTAPWLHAQLSGDDRERAVALRKSVAEAHAPSDGLNPVAALLRATVTALLPKPEITLAIDNRLSRPLPGVGPSTSTRSWTLSAPASDFTRARIRANAARLATPSGHLDWTYARQAGLSVAGEIIELLVTPVPGGLSGLNRVRLIAFGGHIGVGLVQGSFDAARSDGAGLAGSTVDILDLAFGCVSGRTAAKTQFRQAGYRRVTLGSGVDGLWRFDPDAMVRPPDSMLDGQQPSNDGVIHVLGRSFVSLEQPSGTKAVFAASRGNDGVWRLRPNDEVGYAPAIKRVGNHWVLDIDDTPRLDATLLSRALSMAGMSATSGSGMRLQDVTGVTRAELDSIWRGETPPSWFDGAATRIAVLDMLSCMQSSHPRHGEPLHALGETLYAQFLADTLRKRVHVVNDNGVTACLLDPRVGPAPDGAEFMLHRQPGGFYAAQHQAPHGERVGIPGMLDVALAEQPALGASHAASKGVSTLQARRRVVEAASDAWFSRHAREIERASLAAFDLELPRQANDFLAAGKIAAGQRAPAPDARDQATVAQLQYRYAGLTRADALAALADQTLGPLARDEPDADALASVLGDLRTFSRVISARFRALTGQHDADSEALLLAGLTAHAAWPADRFIEVFQGGTHPATGEVINHGVSVARFGRGCKALNLVRTTAGSHHVADAQGTVTVVPPQPGVPPTSLVLRVIEALPDADKLRLRPLPALKPASIVASMDMPATLKVLGDAAAYGVRASTPLDDSYAQPITPDVFPDVPVDGYYSYINDGVSQRFVQLDDMMVRAVPTPADPARARLVPLHTPTEPDAPEALVRRDSQGHWRLIRIRDAVRHDLVDWESTGGGYARPSTLQMPTDGIRSTLTVGGTWREIIFGTEQVKVTFDFDFQAWRGIDNPGRVFRRVAGKWREGAVTGPVDTPKKFSAIQVPSVPLPPIEALPLPKTIGYGWTGAVPSAKTLSRLAVNGDIVHDGATGWSSHLYLDLEDASQVNDVRASLADHHVKVSDLRRDPAFIAWLATPAGELYTAARDGAHPCYAAAMDVLRFGWILKRHGGLYVDVDDVILNSWTRDVEFRAGPYQLVSGGPVTQPLLGLDGDINTSHLGSHARNPLLDRIVETMVERAARKPNFFNEARPASNEAFGRALSELTGPGVLRDVLQQHAPEIGDIIAAMRVLKANAIRHEALELAVAAANDSYFPLADLIDSGHDNSWARSDD